MLIEVHAIQNHGPANLNRDDLGAPKTCIFGGVTRARISSQCLKRSIRRSPEFARALENDGGVRTRRLIELIAQEAAGKGNPPSKEHYEAIRKVFVDGGVGMKDGNTSDILFFLPESAIKEMGAAVRRRDGDLGGSFAKVIGKLVTTPDIALCGRMTEFNAKGPFRDLKGQFGVEAALSVAHAISTHAVVNEVDYFTATDDVPGQDAGAAHINEAMYNSACFYKHFVIDLEQLTRNLANDVDLAFRTVRCFLEAAVRAYPSGKQHAFAAFNPPDGVLVEVKAAATTPISYTNAFADPVPEGSERGLVGESIFRLGRYVHDLVVGYGIEAERFWFSPNLRYHLTWVDQGMRGHEQEQPVANSGEYGELDELVRRVMDRVKETRLPVGAAK